MISLGKVASSRPIVNIKRGLNFILKQAFILYSSRLVLYIERGLYVIFKQFYTLYSSRPIFYIQIVLYFIFKQVYTTKIKNEAKYIDYNNINKEINSHKYNGSIKNHLIDYHEKTVSKELLINNTKIIKELYIKET